MVGSSVKKNMVSYLMLVYSVSLTRACQVISLAKSMYYYRSCKDDSEMIKKLLSLAEKKPREGQDKFYQRIRNEGLQWNYKRVRRVYKLLELNIRRKTKKRIPARVKEPLQQAEKPNQVWSVDFMSDSLMNGRKCRTLNVMDDFSRRAVTVDAAFSIPALQLISFLERAMAEQGKPKKIRSDNGPEFTSATFTDWCKANKIELLYIQPGKPMQNGYIGPAGTFEQKPTVST
jgi:putative transposase